MLLDKLLFNKWKSYIKGMVKITKEEVKKVAHLARLELNENEINSHADQLEKILEYIKQLEKIDTNDIPCTTRAIEVINVFRKDQKRNSDCTQDLLELSPSREDNYFKVPKIINLLPIYKIKKMLLKIVNKTFIGSKWFIHL